MKTTANATASGSNKHALQEGWNLVLKQTMAAENQIGLFISFFSLLSSVSSLDIPWIVLCGGTVLSTFVHQHCQPPAVAGFSPPSSQTGADSAPH